MAAPRRCRSPDALIDRFLQTNLASPLRITRSVLPHLTRPSGRIINISSISNRRDILALPLMASAALAPRVGTAIFRPHAASSRAERRYRARYRRLHLCNRGQTHCLRTRSWKWHRNGGASRVLSRRRSIDPLAIDTTRRSLKDMKAIVPRRFEGRVVVVTGAAGALGRACAASLASEGAE
ncbi:SDR family NAD(P)-dependent oxidoreductase [Bradyrhizobium sp. WSM3983]|uniref:SDR family NAD(P)-dependent oxidoreductase n=1 Tax=Bradyrhizobium sp. WSM3983 TaxID=1038867 RepID=UPI0018DBD03F